MPSIFCSAPRPGTSLGKPPVSAATRTVTQSEQTQSVLLLTQDACASPGRGGTKGPDGGTLVPASLPLGLL